PPRRGRGLRDCGRRRRRAGGAPWRAGSRVAGGGRHRRRERSSRALRCYGQMLSVCCQSGDPQRLAALLPIMRPVADEIVGAVDDRADLRLLGTVASVGDRLFLFTYADPPERAFQWLHEQTSGDWVFRIDDDEAPSAALLDLLARPLVEATHAFVPRRWLWQDGWLDQYPWRPDWQLRLARRDAV